VLAHFGTWLAGQGEDAGIEAVTRPLLERYLAALHAEFGGRKLQREHIENLNGFLTAVHQHEWDRRQSGRTRPSDRAGEIIWPEQALTTSGAKPPPRFVTLREQVGPSCTHASGSAS